MKVNLSDPILSRLLYLLETCGWIDMDAWDMEAIAKRAGCYFFHGVSKGCFMHNSWDFVVKIPYYGCEASKDYCAEEEIAYLEIKEKYPLCAKLFAETEYLCKCGEIRVYVQKKVAKSADELAWDGGKFFDTILDYCHDLDQWETFKEDYFRVSSSRIGSAFCAAVIRAYGYRVFRSLCKWILDTDQNDLHGSNVGYTENNLPIIFDFSGWYENPSSEE